MPKKPTAVDAQLILQLYDLRREAEIRKARNWWATSFWPETLEDFMKLLTAFGTQENAWLRQVSGYWNLAASLALAGTVNQELFLDPSFCGEMFLIYAKVKPFLKELRARTQNPHIFANVEKLITGSKRGRDFLTVMETQVANFRKMMAERKAS